ncbi:hypothetical protein AMTRI_Chr04g183830 [Amborella trichopoda]
MQIRGREGFLERERACTIKRGREKFLERDFFSDDEGRKILERERESNGRQDGTRSSRKQVFVGTVRIDLYLNCSEIGNARKVFDEMEVKDAITFTAMISGHCRIGELSFSQELFDAMPEINTASWNALIDGYLKGGDIEKAASLFDEMSHKDLVSWTTMTSRFSKNGRFKEAAVFKEMEAQVVSPDAVTMATMI